MTNLTPLSNKKEFNKSSTPLLEINNLTVDYPTTVGNIRAVDDVSLNLYSGEVLGLVGESGCGKSTLGFSLLRLLRGGVIRSGNIIFEGKDLLSLPKTKIRKLRGSDISMVFQASQNALNPLQTISKHFIDTLKVHNRWNPEKWQDVKSLLQRLEIPESRLDDYAFQFSGGMQQRIVIALTLMLNPKLIIADEPTTALDVLVQARLLQLLKEIIREFKLTVIYITHNLGVVAEITQRVAIMYAGRILEVGDTFTIFENSAHPYTQALISAIPNVKDESKRKMSFIPGHPPDLKNPPKGCCFADRCSYSIEICKTTLPKPISLPSNGHMVKCLMYDEDFSSKFS
ncbi:MAG: ABC transporter ATP-binding protein [Candidatus Hodarchaeota archaeon]